MKTAIDWLVEQVNADCLNSTFIRPELIEQAKKIEKEQSMDFALKFMMQDRPVVSFYNETYGGDK